MPKCPFLLSKRFSVTCDPSGMQGCPKHKNRDNITPECWRLRRLETKEALDSVPKEKIYRNTKLKCPKCKFKFQAKEGIC
jgi:hypothetical protein